MRYAKISVVGIFLSFSLWASENTLRWFPQPLSPRNANYIMDAFVDMPNHSIDGFMVLTWKNIGTQPTDRLPLHLYLNAFKGPGSIFQKEGGQQLRSDRQSDQQASSSWGYCQLLKVQSGGRELRGWYGEDETVYWVQLPAPVRVGGSIDIEITWKSVFPKVYARTGWSEGFLMAAQWFPKVGVYQGATWECEPFHANTEFFSDYGVYDVRVNVPRGLWVAHTGEAIPFLDPSDQQQKDAWPDPKDKNRMVYRLHAEDVHDFAFAVKSNFNWKRREFTFRGIRVAIYYEEENTHNIYRHQDAIEASLRLTEEWFFKYPYPVLTIIDPPSNAAGADGMEYPTLITASSVRFDPLTLRMPEVVAVHEFGHQFFYGLLGSNEVKEPWLDEGMNSWLEDEIMEQRFSGILKTQRFSIKSPNFASYRGGIDVDPLNRPGYAVRNAASYGRMAYVKPAVVLQQLKATVGPKQMKTIMQSYTQEMRFKHPTHLDFKRIVERVTQKNFDKFWADYIDGTGTLDYRIASVQNRSKTNGGWNFVTRPPLGDTSRIWFEPIKAAESQGQVNLERRGDIISPITLKVFLTNGAEVSVRWDGQDRWKRFEFDAPIARVMLDPDHEYPILRNRFYLTWDPTPPATGLRYWAQLIAYGLSYLLQIIGLG